MNKNNNEQLKAVIDLGVDIDEDNVFIDIMREAESTFEKHRDVVDHDRYLSKEEFDILMAILQQVVRQRSGLSILAVENYDNFIAYGRLFGKISNKVPFQIGNKNIIIIAINDLSTYMYSGIRNIVEERLESGYTPLVAIFTVDFIPSQMVDKLADIIDLASAALLKPDIYVILFTTMPNLVLDTITVARYAIILDDPAPSIIAKRRPQLAKYASTIGFDVILRSNSEDDVINYVEKRRLPIPPFIEEVRRPFRFPELILNNSIVELIKVNVLEPLKQDFTSVPSLMLIGPTGVGKTTLAYAIGRELGVRSYIMYVESTVSKWVGETEKNINHGIKIINDAAPAIGILANIQSILRTTRGSGGAEENIAERIKSLLAYWVRSEKRRVPLIFTLSSLKNVPEDVLNSPIYGMFKIPLLPPLKVEDRKIALVKFLTYLSEKHGIKFNPFQRSIEEALNTVAEKTWGFTFRELFSLAKTCVNISLGKGIITKESIERAKQLIEIDRISRIQELLDIIKVAKKLALPEKLLYEIYEAEATVNKYRSIALEEEAKRRSIAKALVK